jgi:hypothetical protein
MDSGALIMRERIVLIFAALLCCGWPAANMGGGVPAAAGGDACASATDYLATANSAFFISDTDWVTDTLPDDEVGSLTATVSQTNGLEETSLVAVGSGGPAGSDSSYYFYPMAAGDSIGWTDVHPNIRDAGLDGMLSMWVKITGTVGDDFLDSWGPANLYQLNSITGPCTTASCICWNPVGTDFCAQDTDHNATWIHIAVGIEEGPPGTDDLYIYINGVQQATLAENTSWNDDGGAIFMMLGGAADPTNGEPMDVHEVVFITGTTPTEAMACEIMECGAAGTATGATRRSTYGDCAAF